MNVLLGILFVISGIAFMYFSRKFEIWFGRWEWAEQYLGGTAQGYIIIGFVCIIVGVMALFGVIDLTR